MFTPHQYFTFINTEEDANQYIVPSNTTVLLICRNAPYFFIKSSDSLGQYTTDRYEFKKAPRVQQTTVPDNLVTMDQFNSFKDEIRALLTTNTQPKEDINNNAIQPK
jgi:hypothetical protein